MGEAEETENTESAAFSISQQIIDEVLTSGGNEENSALRIVAYFKKDYPAADNAEFLIREYRTGGKGFIFGGNHVAAWFDAAGLRIAVGDTAQTTNVSLITWEQAAARIRELLDLGRYMSQSDLRKVDGNEIWEIADKLYFLYRDDYGGLPADWTIDGPSHAESTPVIAIQLYKPATLDLIRLKLENDIQLIQSGTQEQDIRNVNAFRKNALDILQRVLDLQREPITFTSAEAVSTPRPGFITQDEVDRLLIRGGNVENTKSRIYAYFSQNHTAKEKADFLKQEYGTGGASRTGFTEWHDSKGISYSRENNHMPYDKVILSWPKIAKRIDELIADGRYMSQIELNYYQSQKPVTPTPPMELQTQEPAPADASVNANAQLNITTKTSKSNRQIKPEPQPSTYSNNENVVYDLRLGATVYLGIEEFELYSFDDKLVVLSDVTAPLITIELPREVFERRLRENRLNDGLIKSGEPEAGAEAVINTDTEPEPYVPKKGEYYEIEGRKFAVDRVDLDWNTVSLKDITFEGNTGLPIFRSESLDFIRMYKPTAQIPAAQTEQDIQADIQVQPEPLTDNDAKDVPITPAWEKPKPRNQARTFDPYPEIPMAQRSNFRISDDDLGAGGQKTKYKNNIAAIRALKDIEAENRFATSDEQEILSRYVGWGALQQAFDPDNKQWTDEYSELNALLTPDEYASARASTVNAHYSSPTVIKAIYKAIENMGLRNGNVLEPSCGIGNFFGLVPESMSEAKFFGVELDSLTGRIARQLYQKNNIAIQGFEKTELPDSFFDLAVGNVPFGSYGVNDKRYDKHKFHIHDYFFARTLDKIRPGGIVAFVTSRYTLDKKDPTIRRYIAQRAELLGAIRLPSTAFKSNAGTEVTTDIIFLQKRDRIIDMEPEWVHLGEVNGIGVDGQENKIPVNYYFEENPDMILGTMSNEDGGRMYGAESSLTCVPFPDANLSEQLNEAITNIHAEITEYEHGEDEPEEDNSIAADPDVRNFSYTVVGGHIFYRQDSRMVPVEMPVTAQNRVKGLIELRECVRNLIMYQAEDYPERAIITEQIKLNRLYDIFIKKYGLINSRGNSMAFSQDSAYCLLCSLEVLNENGELERKADMFSRRTIKAHIPITHADTATEALAASMGEKARVDLAYMSQLTDMSEETLIKELEGVIFLNIENDENQDKTYVTADEYLSGNVREKLIKARAAQDAIGDGSFNANIAALEAVLPPDLSAAEISVRLGATWLPEDIIQRFMYELLQTGYYARDRIKVHYSHHTGGWNITEKRADRSNIHSFNTYGTERINAYKIIEESLNLRDVRIFDKTVDANGDEKRVLNKKETAIAQAKQELIRTKFDEWIWKDPGRRERLCRIYNDKFNSIRPRVYDGSHLTFPGMNPEISLRKHQVDAIAHILCGGNTLLAHVVGAGKTFEMIAAAMESKRIGLCNKSLMVVPNHITEQWASEFLQLYPSANILVATRKDFETRNRKKFCARIATGEYDAIIIGHSQFEKIPMSEGRQRFTLVRQINELIDGIAEIKENRGEKFTIKQMEKMKKSLEVRLEKLNDQSRKDNVVNFEELGIDRLYIDEAHYFKNLYLISKMRNVGGIAQTEAQKSSDLFMKTQYLDEITGGRGCVFATGTPISNSMVELYTMQRYLQYGELIKHNLQNFDAWASTFGETVTAIELAPEGTGYRSKTRFARFYNLPELMSMFRMVADIQTSDMLDLPVPKANFHNEVIKPSQWQQDMIAELAERADAIRKGDVDPTADNMLLVTNDGRKLALDQRLINPMLPDDPNGKVAVCAENVFRIWDESKEKRLTQLIFSDLSTPKGDGSFNIYDDMKTKLIAKGVPAEEIAFIHNADTEAKKVELFAKVRKGQVRILLGSTQKMGAGMNVQDKLIALHDCDCPWRPSDLQQRSGRIIRQGNKNPEVEIFRYVTQNTFDSYLFQLIENKQKFVAQIMTSKTPVRSAEDVDEQALSYAEIKALATGNPLIIEKCQLDLDVNKLKILRANHLSQQYDLEDKIIKEYPKEIKRLAERAAGFVADIKTVEEHTPTDKEIFPPMKVGGILYDKKTEAGKAILDACKAMQSPKPVPLGEYRGFNMELSFDTFSKEYRITLKCALSHEVSLGTDVHGNITRLDNRLENFTDALKNCEKLLTDVQAQMESAKSEVNSPFPQEQEYTEKSARLKEVNILLNMDQKDHEILDVEPDEGDLELTSREVTRER